MNNILELFRTNIGSHMWAMQHAQSDIDVAIVYLMDSRDYLLGKRIKGKQKAEGEYDYTYYELGMMIDHLLKGNVNFIWAVMSPIMISKYKSAFEQLQQIVAVNIAKNCYNSINGLSKHNIYHFIEQGDKYSKKYQKKLNVIGRTLKFGINALMWGKFLFEKVDIKTEEELWHLKSELDKAYKYSSLPENPNPKPFQDYLIKWRLHKLKVDGLIE